MRFTTKLLFTGLRLLQLLALLPIIGILAHFIALKSPAEHIITLFIISTLAAAWALVGIVLLIFRRTPLYMAVLDVCIFAALVAGVVLLDPFVRGDICRDWADGEIDGKKFRKGSDDDDDEISEAWGAGYMVVERRCAVLRAVWALAVAAGILFVGTAALAAQHVWNHSRTVTVVPLDHPQRRRLDGRYPQFMEEPIRTSLPETVTPTADTITKTMPQAAADAQSAQADKAKQGGGTGKTLRFA
jgi:hypothetical protein